MLRQYKHYSSDFGQWDQKPHAQQYLLYPKNIGPHLSIDEVALSKGELVTLVTNKAPKGGKGSLVAMIAACAYGGYYKCTASHTPAAASTRCRSNHGYGQKHGGRYSARISSGKAGQGPLSLRGTTYHVSQLVNEVVQGLRIKQRWIELELEAEAVKTAKEKGLKYEPEELLTGESPKQLLARSRYILYKNAHKWSPNQRFRSFVLFDRYPT